MLPHHRLTLELVRTLAAVTAATVNVVVLLRVFGIL